MSETTVQKSSASQVCNKPISTRQELLDHTNNEGKSALVFAVENNVLDAVRLLVESGATINVEVEVEDKETKTKVKKSLIDIAQGEIKDYLLNHVV